MAHLGPAMWHTLGLHCSPTFRRWGRQEATRLVRGQGCVADAPRTSRAGTCTPPRLVRACAPPPRGIARARLPAARLSPMGSRETWRRHLTSRIATRCSLRLSSSSRCSHWPRCAKGSSSSWRPTRAVLCKGGTGHACQRVLWGLCYLLT